ncbi:MAG: GtrA family protein [Hyphomonadaceae bacterium]
MRLAALTADTMRVLGEDRARYVMVSATALAIDTLITLNLAWAGVAPALSAAAGYVIGLALHWVLSTRFVFAAELGESHGARARQAALFFASGVGGLAVTVAAFTTAMTLGVPALISKASAVAVSFCVVYLIRRHLIFPQRS